MFCKRKARNDNVFWHAQASVLTIEMYIYTLHKERQTPLQKELPT